MNKFILQSVMIQEATPFSFYNRGMGGFAEKIGSTWCFNPGRRDTSQLAFTPNRITLTLAPTERRAMWEYALDDDGNDGVCELNLEDGLQINR